MNRIFFFVKFQSWKLAQDTLFKPVITATKMFIKRSFNSIGDSLKISRWFFTITSYGDARWGRSLMHSNPIKCCNRSSCEDVPRVPLFLPTKNIVLQKKLFSFSLSYFDYLRHLRFFCFYFLIGTLNELKLKFKIGCGLKIISYCKIICCP